MNQSAPRTLAGGGVYSPYVGAIVDTARILSSLHTAHFQYIPALALPKADSLNLRLNMPPSFRNPKSVVVVALPPIGPARPEPLHPVNPEDNFCAMKPGLVLPAEGAPLVFATELAHDLVLQMETTRIERAPAVDLPLKADPGKGGLVPSEPLPKLPEWRADRRGSRQVGIRRLGGAAIPSVHGAAGQVERDCHRSIGAGGGPRRHAALRRRNLGLRGEGGSADRSAATRTLAWKSPKPDTLEVTMPLKDASRDR